MTAHLIDEGVDTGPIIDQLSLPIHPDETGYELHLKAAHLSTELCARLLRHWLRERSLPAARPQQGTPSLHRARDATLNALDLNQGATRIRNIVRALCPPFPGATLELGGEHVVIGRVERLEHEIPRETPGTIAVSTEVVVLHTADDPLVVDRWYDGERMRHGDELATRLRRDEA